MAIGDIVSRGVRTAFDMRNQVKIDTTQVTIAGVAVAMDSYYVHINPSTPGAHSIDNIAGLQDALNTKSNIGHVHTISSVTGLQTVLDAKENVFSKNTAFNKNFGTSVGTVCEGNDGRLSDARVPLAHNHNIADVTGLQTVLDNKAEVFSGYTGNIVVITGVDFTAKTTTTATLNINNGIITSIS